MERFQLTKCAASIHASCPRCLSFRSSVFRIRGKICSHSRLMGRSNEAVSTNRKSQGEILQLPRCRIILRAFDGSGLYRGEGWAHFFGRFPFSNFAFDLVCATFWRAVCVYFFFSLIYRGKFKGDRTEIGLFIYLIYTLLRMYFLRSYSWKYLFSYSFLIRGGYEDRKIFRF